MGDVHYLPLRNVRPPAARRSVESVRRPSAPALRVAMSLTQLASVLTGETASLDGRVGARAAALVAAMPSRAPGARNRLDVGAKRPAPARPGPTEPETTPRTPTRVGSDAFSLAMVRAGRPILDSRTASRVSDSAFGEVALRGEGRREGEHALPAFAFTDPAALERVLGDALRGHRSRIEAWLRQGGNPPLRLRYHARDAFGSVLHEGADELSPLHGVGLVVSAAGGAAGEAAPIVTAEFTLAPG